MSGLPEEPKKKLESKQQEPKKPEAKDPDRDPTTPDAPRLERKWLAEQSKDQLIEIILELKAKLPQTTAALDNVASTPFGTKIDTKVDRFLPLPTVLARKREDNATWRLTLISSGCNHPPLGLEIRDDVLVGRAGAGIKADLDLTEYDGVRLGVSRQHALLRPTENSLFLMDLDSTNGTYHNGRKLSSRRAQKLSQDDMISFGNLHFSIRVVKQPQEKPRAISGQDTRPTLAHTGSSKVRAAASRTN